MKPIRIYLGDLTHDTIIVVSDTIPINVGFIAAYAKKLFGNDIEVSLFKYPQSLLDAIHDQPPDVIALSNYSWNSHLSEYVSSVAKIANPRVVSVQGGTNFPHQAPQQLEFLLRRPATDFHTVFEGEASFANIVRRVLDARDNGTPLFGAPVDGAVFIEPSTRESAEPILVTSPQPPRIKELDEIPSPYLTGLLDNFFDGRLTPFIETNRGCPFKCSFCHTGADYFRKINMFSIERVNEEINFIAPRMAELGIVNLHIADTNFGMFPRDREICDALHRAHAEFGWPRQIMATTGKNNKERVIDITDVLGKMFSVNMSVQSMNDEVLANINRSNIKLDHYLAINEHLREKGRATKAELIIGLPGETRDSFMQGVEQVVEAGVSSTTIYTLMLLHGTVFQSPAYRELHGIKGKFRIVPLDFGEYDGHRVLDYEEVAVATNTMSFADYLYLRGFALLVETLLNGRPFDEIFRYVASLGINRAQFLRHVYDHMDEAPEGVRAVVDGFMEETEGELWESEDALVRHYQKDENYQRLLQGEVGGNLIFKYKSRSVAFTTDTWLEFLSGRIKAIMAGKAGSAGELERIEAEVDCLTDFCHNKTAGLLDADARTAPLTGEYPFDIVGWMAAAEGARLTEFACSPPIRYVFSYDDAQMQTRADLFKRYGTDVNALSKIVTRISNLESLFRNIDAEFQEADSAP